MRRFAIILLLALALMPANAAVIDSLQVHSKSMNKDIPVVVIKPADYNASVEYPVVYLLHGYSGNQRDWFMKAPEITGMVDMYKLLIVCPDGGFSSWYWDSPVDPSSQYETFVSDELIKTIDGKYSTIKSRSGRGITGLSMGGHGALYLAFRHQDIFGAAGSMSGGVDIRPFPEKWEMASRLGKYSEQPERWEKNTVINLLYLLTPNSLAIIIDCGTDDFFSKVNENLHQQLLYRNIPHDYISRPGAHTWSYWKNSIKFQMLFMKNYFDSNSEQPK